MKHWHRHSPIFWVAMGASLLTGAYGLVIRSYVLAIPYGILNPLAFTAISSLLRELRVKHAVEFLAALIIFINIPGSVYFHSLGIQYDIPLHFLTSFFAFQILTILLFTRVKNRPLVLAVSFALVVLGGFGFEGFQSASDILFGSHLFFDALQPIRIDFTIDILMNTAGALLGLLLALSHVSFIKNPATQASAPLRQSGQNRGE